MHKNGLIIFAREPRLGKVKTRLAAELGDQKTLLLYKKFIIKTLRLAKELKGVDCYIYYAGSNAALPFLSRYKKSFILKQQRGGDLGERMYNSLDYLYTRGYKRAVIIGTDCLELTLSDIQMAYKALYDADYVLGPSKDGGYYLLGVQKPYKAIFSGITWGGNQVLKQTFAKIKKQSKTVRLLPVRTDIDYLEDWMEYSKNNCL